MNKILVVLSSLFLIVLAGCLPVAVVKQQPDHSLYLPKFEIESLKFYTANEKGLEKAFRIYNNSFRVSSIDRIWYELIIKNLSDKDTKVTYKEVWLNGENRIISSVIKEMNLKSGDKYLEYTAGIKTDWMPGYFVLELYQDSLEIAKREFKIID